MRRIIVLIACGLFVPRLYADEPVDYATQIKPVLVARCYACHSALRKKSGLRLDTAAAFIAGGESGPAIEPGNADGSYLIEMLTGESGMRMPPESEGSALSAEQIALFRKWINEGAHAPAETPQADPREHWAYHPPLRPDVPQLRDSAWVRNPVDAFIGAGYEAKGLTPVAEADRATLLRRVYLDLIGLPPTRDELSAFLANNSPTAYDEVVDHLLASPQYGERWARHWMDIWRYSDWSGYKEEVRDSCRHIWRWRDWIVESLNSDKGYDQMAIEMLAGDEIAPTDPDTLRATGFLVRDWYKFNRDVWLQATVEHTGKAFLGVTMNCCRCHDHKFDPISQVEYYQFRSIFEPYNLRTERVPGESDLTKNGVSRACDLTPETPTYLFERGDDKRPKKDLAIVPGTPAVFGSQLKVAPVDLPVLEYYPALREFAINEDTASAAQQVAAAEAAVTKAELAVAAAQKAIQAKSGEPAVVAQSTGAAAVAGPQVAPTATTPPDSKSEAKANDKAAAAAKKAPSPLTVDVAVAAAEVVIKQLATARAAQTALSARVAADRAKYGLTPNVNKDELALAAGKAERELALCQAQQQQATAANELATAKAAAKPNDTASTNAVAAAEKHVTEAAASLAKAHAELAEPSAKYQPLGIELPHQSTGRRLAFARWLVDRQNPLAARVAVNHVWLRHFGAPLVDNPFDFGPRSPQPRNQPLLDWLAVELMDHGWQMKHLHRLIVTSNAYRMSSSSVGAPANDLAADRDNQYLWRMNTRRLEGEVVRDSVFYTAGNLDLTRGGPDIAFKLASETPRRSIYFQHADEKMNKLLQVFDSPSVNECYRRSESIVPQQALAMANSDVSLNASRSLAKKLSDLAGSDGASGDKFIALAYKQILSRDPSAVELNECETFLTKQAELFHDPGKLTSLTGGPRSTTAAAPDPMQRARENLTLILYNHNDFITAR